MKKLRVFGVPWHVAHQYELAKLPWIGQYDMLINPYRTWGEEARPFPKNCRWVTSFKKGYYDLAILHVDQQCVWEPEKGHKIAKGRLYQEARDVVGDDCPVIVINHMTPFHDRFDTDYVVDYFKREIGDRYMVVNSFEAAKQWGWGHPIIHGMEASQWYDLPKEPRIVTALTPAGMEKAYRRVFLHTVKRYLDEEGVPFVWIGVDIKFRSFEEYAKYLGKALIYFNATWQSPRPRSRTEAMLSGACIVTTPYQDAHTFIEDGVNGFLTSKQEIKDPRIMDNPRVTANLLKDLVINRPKEAIAIGKEGKKTALSLFNERTFAKQWEQVLKEVGVI